MHMNNVRTGKERKPVAGIYFLSYTFFLCCVPVGTGEDIMWKYFTASEWRALKDIVMIVIVVVCLLASTVYRARINDLEARIKAKSEYIIELQDIILRKHGYFSVNEPSEKEK